MAKRAQTHTDTVGGKTCSQLSEITAPSVLCLRYFQAEALGVSCETRQTGRLTLRAIPSQEKGCRVKGADDRGGRDGSSVMASGLSAHRQRNIQS